jgi:protein-disulfide isomerase
VSKRTWIIFVIIIVGVMGALVVASKSGTKKIDISSVNTSAIQTANDKDGNIADHTQGNLDSKVILIEYGDYQCPPCANAYPTVKSLIEKYSDKVLFVFRNFPIPSLHPNARAAAADAEAAGLQNKYWEMHDKLYENQSAWSSASTSERTTIFTNYASQIGLDIDKFTKDVSLDSIVAKIDFDVAVGQSVKVEGTPTFKLNGENVNLNDLDTTIQSKL